jgi:hypothetical protein
LQSTIYENEVKLFTTSEGLFVMETQSFKDNQKRLNIKINDDNPKTIQQLALSDIDYKTHILLRSNYVLIEQIVILCKQYYKYINCSIISFLLYLILMVQN